MSYIDKTKLLTDVNNGIKAGNFEEGYEQYQNINNMDDIIEAIEWADEEDVIERSEIDKAIEELRKEIEENHLNVIEYADGEWIVKEFIYGAIDRLKEKIALDKR